MIALYCHKHHNIGDGLCPECQALVEYAHLRLDHCKFGERKPSCQKCPVHCYQPEMREAIRKVMRYAGPRMFWHHPLAAIRYTITK